MKPVFLKIHTSEQISYSGPLKSTKWWVHSQFSPVEGSHNQAHSPALGYSKV